MKAICATALCMMTTLATGATNADVRSEVDQVLKPLSDLLNSDPTGIQAAQRLNQSNLPGRVFVPYFQEVQGAPHENSEDRRKRVSAVEALLEPYEPVLFRVLKARSTGHETQGTTGLDGIGKLLEFVRPTKELNENLQAIIGSDQSDPRAVVGAFDVLFRQALDDAKTRSQVAKRIAAFAVDGQTNNQRESMIAGNLYSNAVGYWGAFPELMDVYQALLEEPFTKENFSKYGGKGRLVGKYGAAASGLSRFGLAAARLRPILVARMAELDPSNGDQRTAIDELRECIERIDGKRIPKLTVNWKSQFLGQSESAYKLWQQSPQSASDKQSDRQAPRPSAINAPKQLDATKPASVPTAATNEQQDTTSWALVIVMIAAAMGLLWLVLKRRAK